jgi:hypothetical protein
VRSSSFRRAAFGICTAAVARVIGASRRGWCIARIASQLHSVRSTRSTRNFYEGIRVFVRGFTGLLSPRLPVRFWPGARTLFGENWSNRRCAMYALV